MNAALLLALALVNHALTPGAVRPLTLATICTTKWGLDARHVDDALRARVFDAYGIPAAARRGYVIDHLVPRELGGADVFGNLWPELEAPSHRKDGRERALHNAVCATNPTITLEAAQNIMRAWSGP